MSVYKPAKSRFWQYDFVIEGRRVYGSTGQASRRAAEAVERQRRLEAATGSLNRVARMTLDEAAGKWWSEVGIDRGDAVDVERRINRLLDIIGKNTVLANINQATISDAIETRRHQKTKRGKAKDAKAYAPSNATVNRDIIETLRPILRRAKTHWTPKGEAHGLPEMDWKELRLKEPRPISRQYSAAEKEAWLAACPDDLRLALDMLLAYGLRFGELLFPPDAYTPDPEFPNLTLQKGRKRDVILRLPMRSDHARDLAARVTRAKAAGLDHLWFYQGPKGKLFNYSYAQIEYRLSKAADKAGVSGGRRIHGARHHAASNILRKTGSMKNVQTLLGHASPLSSNRYAHVLAESLRDVLESDVSRNSPEAVRGDETETKAG